MENDSPNPFLDALRETESLAATLVGLDEASAVRSIAEAGRSTRVVQRDGERFSLRADFRSGRINLTIESGVVVATRVG
jgi:hypothetical protein